MKKYFISSWSKIGGGNIPIILQVDKSTNTITKIINDPTGGFFVGRKYIVPVKYLVREDRVIKWIFEHP